jgi:GNAT superfamily N-acetyltransferase
MNMQIRTALQIDDHTLDASIIHTIHEASNDGVIMLRNNTNAFLSWFPLDEDRHCHDEIRDFLDRHYDDFVPLLSERHGYRHDFSEHGEANGIDGYMSAMKGEGIRCIAMRIGDALAAIMLVQPDAEHGGLYAPLMLTDHEYRGLGAMTAMFSILERLADSMGTTAMIRTRSTNAEINHILSRRGWITTQVKENDRGEGIHTTYHCYGGYYTESTLSSDDSAYIREGESR